MCVREFSLRIAKYAETCRRISNVLLYLDRNYCKSRGKLTVYDLGGEIFRRHFTICETGGGRELSHFLQRRVAIIYKSIFDEEPPLVVDPPSCLIGCLSENSSTTYGKELKERVNDLFVFLMLNIRVLHGVDLFNKTYFSTTIMYENIKKTEQELVIEHGSTHFSDIYEAYFRIKERLKIFDLECVEGIIADSFLTGFVRTQPSKYFRAPYGCWATWVEEGNWQIISKLYTLYTLIQEPVFEIEYESYVEAAVWNILETENGNPLVSLKELFDRNRAILIGHPLNLMKKLQPRLKNALTRTSSLLTVRLAEAINDLVVGVPKKDIKSLIDTYAMIPLSALDDHGLFGVLYTSGAITRLLDIKTKSFVTESCYWDPELFDCEAQILKCLSAWGGEGMRQKMDSFMSDIETSRVVDISFNTADDANDTETSEDGNFQVIVLKAIILSDNGNIILLDSKMLSQPFIDRIELFSNFYASILASSHRKLSWVANYGHCLVQFTPQSRSFMICCSTIQAIILLLLNHHRFLTLPFIYDVFQAKSPERTSTIDRHLSGLHNGTSRK